MITIREFRKSDWPQIESWWKSAGVVQLPARLMPEHSSFVAEVGGVPALAVSIYLTNSQELAITDNFVGNPDLPGAVRREAGFMLSEHIARFAKERGYKRLTCMTEKPKLEKRYVELGYVPAMRGVTTLVRVL